MADKAEIEIKIDMELIQLVHFLQSYKNAADEALTWFNAKDVDDEYLRHGQELALRALNIGAELERVEYSRDIILKALNIYPMNKPATNDE